MVNYPELFEEFGEDLACISLTDPSLEALRQQIVTILSLDSHERLDAPTLYRHLSVGDSAKACRAGLADVLSETTYMHAGFARPERSLEQARQGWKSIWNKHLQELLQAELAAAKRCYAEEATDANLNRLMAMRDQMEQMIRESAALPPEDNTLLDGA
jgi:DNA primase